MIQLDASVPLWGLIVTVFSFLLFVGGMYIRMLRMEDKHQQLAKDLEAMEEDMIGLKDTIESQNMRMEEKFNSRFNDLNSKIDQYMHRFDQLNQSIMVMIQNQAIAQTELKNLSAVYDKLEMKFENYVFK